jgi:hypothetical protein
MSEQKHFTYDGHFTVKYPDMSEAEILGVEFLVPVKVKLKHKSGHVETVNGHVNWADQKAYFFNKPELDGPLSTNMFAFLSGKLAVPSDKYAAADDIREEAGEAYGKFEDLYTQNVE